MAACQDRKNAVSSHAQNNTRWVSQRHQPTMNYSSYSRPYATPHRYLAYKYHPHPHAQSSSHPRFSLTLPQLSAVCQPPTPNHPTQHSSHTFRMMGSAPHAMRFWEYIMRACRWLAQSYTTPVLFPCADCVCHNLVSGKRVTHNHQGRIRPPRTSGSHSVIKSHAEMLM
jgi:hypothetical protein